MIELAPRKEQRRKLEWVGQNGLFSNPVVEYHLAFGLYSKTELRMMRDRARRRLYRVDQSVIRILRPDSPAGLSRFYMWGPQWDSYVQSVPVSDARIILTDPQLRREFLDVTDLEPLGPAGTVRHGLILPVSHARPLGEFVATEGRQEAQAQTESIRNGR